MAPNIKKRNEQDIAEIIPLKRKNYLKSKIYNFQNFIKKNFEDVGNNFPYEARSLHYNNKKNKKGIFGIASKKDIAELNEEGISTQLFPWIEKKDN